MVVSSCFIAIYSFYGDSISRARTERDDTFIKPRQEEKRTTELESEV